jgi:hypothetical protein
MGAGFPFLIELVETATRSLPDVARKRMFGCDAYFAGERIFVLLWKTGRIGVKLTEPADHARLMAHDGAEPWQIGAKLMSNWVLTPEDMHDDVEALTPWIRLAHAQARNKPVARTAAKKTIATKTAAKKTVATKTAAKKPAAKTTVAKKTAARTTAARTTAAKTTTSKRAAARSHARS